MKMNLREKRKSRDHDAIASAAGMDSNLGILLMRQDEKLMAALALSAGTRQ